MSNSDNLNIKEKNIQNISFKELSIIKSIIFWVDIIPLENTTKNAIFARPFNDKNAIPQQLTSDNYHIKSKFHGYGAKSYQCIEVDDQIYLICDDQLSKAMTTAGYEKYEENFSKSAVLEKYLTFFREIIA